MNIHVDTPRVKCFIDSNILFGQTNLGGELFPCEIYAISSYAGHYPTFKVIVTGAYLFDYIPIHFLQSRMKVLGEFSYHELYFKKDCPDNTIEVDVHDALRGKEVNVLFPEKGEWIKGKYLFSVDWPESNQSGLFVELENGRFSIVPNHKLKIFKENDNSPLPNFKKLRGEWKV